MVNSLGLMEGYMLENSLMVNNIVKEFILMHMKKKEVKRIRWISNF